MLLASETDPTLSGEIAVVSLYLEVLNSFLEGRRCLFFSAGPFLHFLEYQLFSFALCLKGLLPVSPSSGGTKGVGEVRYQHGGVFLDIPFL